MREELEALGGLHAQLLAVDPHEVWSAKSLLAETGLKTDDLRYPLLMDPSLTVSATYGLPFQMRIHVEWSNRPATFVIDTAGIIRYARRATSFSDRPGPADVIAEIEKAQSSVTSSEDRPGNK